MSDLGDAAKAAPLRKLGVEVVAADVLDAAVEWIEAHRPPAWQ